MIVLVCVNCFFYKSFSKYQDLVPFQNFHRQLISFIVYRRSLISFIQVYPFQLLTEFCQLDPYHWGRHWVMRPSNSPAIQAAKKVKTSSGMWVIPSGSKGTIICIFTCNKCRSFKIFFLLCAMLLLPLLLCTTLFYTNMLITLISQICICPMKPVIEVYGS